MQAHKVKPVLCFEWLIIELGREAFLSPRDVLLQVIVICYYYYFFFLRIFANIFCMKFGVERRTPNAHLQ